METKETERRRFLTSATLLLALSGAAATSVPFIESWQPGARARVAGSPVTVKIDKLEAGRMITVKWQRKPVFILRRTKANLKTLTDSRHLKELRDPDSRVDHQPDYARNKYRSIRPDVFVAVGICTHLGCVPEYVPRGDSNGGEALYFCPCHGSKYDLAGRVYKNVPAPTNLVVPPYHYSGNETLVIGQSKAA